jgi:hypothetical protein
MYRTLHKQRRDQALDLLQTLKKTLRANGRDSEDYVYIFPWGNFGEYTYVLGLLPALRSRHKVCLVVRQNKQWMTPYFPDSYDFAIQIPDAYVDLYEELFEISCLAPGCPYVLFTDILANGRFNSELVVKSNRLTLAESYAFALELPLETPVTPLSIAHRDPGLPAQRATKTARGTDHVLLVPTANTIKNLEPAFWIALYHHLAAHGANPVIDTTFVQWDIGELNSVKLTTDQLVDYVVGECRAVVGLRSGILDLLAGLTKTTDLKIAALYPVLDEGAAPATTGLMTRGVSNKGISIGKCWHSTGVLDIETELAFDPAAVGARLVQFLA